MGNCGDHTNYTTKPVSTVQFFRSERLVGNIGESLYVDAETDTDQESCWQDDDGIDPSVIDKENIMVEMQQVSWNVADTDMVCEADGPNTMRRRCQETPLTLSLSPAYRLHLGSVSIFTAFLALYHDIPKGALSSLAGHRSFLTYCFASLHD